MSKKPKRNFNVDKDDFKLEKEKPKKLIVVEFPVEQDNEEDQPNQIEKRECAVCFEELLENELTNISKKVACACKYPTIHFNCLERSLKSDLGNGLKKMRCPICRKICATKQKPKTKFFSALSNILFAISVINVSYKLSTGLFFALFIGVFLLLLMMRDGITRQRAIFFGGYIAICFFNMVFKVMFVNSIVYLFETCDIVAGDGSFADQNIAMGRFATESQDFFENYKSFEVSNIRCGLGLLSHHLLFEYQLKLYLVLGIKCSIQVYKLLYREKTINIRYK